MIPARRSQWFNQWFARQAAKRMAAMFSAVRIRNIEAVRRAAQEHGSILVVANHTAWWDPLFPIFFFTRVVPLRGFCLMDAVNLRTHPYLGRVGAFGVDLTDPADGAQGILWGARRLRERGSIVFVFPQGRQRPLSEPSLVFRSGAASIARVAKWPAIVPLGLRYEFGEDERPVFWTSFGEPFGYDRDVEAGAEQQAMRVQAELARIDRAICHGEGVHEFTPVIARSAPWLARLAERALVRLTASTVRVEPRSLPEAQAAVAPAAESPDASNA